MTQNDPPPLPVDPNLAQEQQQAQNDLVQSLQTQAQGDTASLMARYGTRLAMSGVAAASPMSAPTTVSPAVAGGSFVSNIASGVGSALMAGKS